MDEEGNNIPPERDPLRPLKDLLKQAQDINPNSPKALALPDLRDLHQKLAVTKNSLTSEQKSAYEQRYTNISGRIDNKELLDEGEKDKIENVFEDIESAIGIVDQQKRARDISESSKDSDLPPQE
jgi:hypothetical protein